MRRIRLRSPIVLVLLLAGIVITALSTSLLYSIDQVVHGDLYRYGLQFDPGWAVKYWTNAKLVLIFLAVSIIATGIAVAFIQFGAETRKVEPANLISYLLLIFGILMIVLSAFFLSQLDNVIHNDLYRYGLQFSYEWAGQYWTYIRLMLSLLGLTIASNAISMGLIFAGTRARVLFQISSTTAISFLLFLVGIMALFFAIAYVSSILAFIGLGFVFWGMMFFHIRPENYIKGTLLDKTTLPILENLDQIICELGYKGKGIYLPPKYLKDFESSKVYISMREDTDLPPPEQIRQDKIVFENPVGILITPLGAELAGLFEEKLGTSFTRVDLEYLKQNMPRLLIEDLEIAQNLEIEIVNNRVNLKIENSIYKNICKEARELSTVCSLGCPLCSAFACALAKATGRPIIKEREEVSDDGRTIDLEYRLLEV